MSTKAAPGHNEILFSLYFYELWSLAHSIKKKSELLFEKAPVPPKDYVITVDMEIHSLIASILSDAANVRKLVKPSTLKRLRGESAAASKVRRARGTALQEAIRGVELTEMLNAKVRNTLEHFDEYLDDAVVELPKAAGKVGWRMAAYNTVMSGWGAITPRVFPVRLYISDERKYYNMKSSVDIGLLHAEACALVERLAKRPDLDAEPSALFVMF